MLMSSSTVQVLTETDKTRRWTAGTSASDHWCYLWLHQHVMPCRQPMQVRGKQGAQMTTNLEQIPVRSVICKDVTTSASVCATAHSSTVTLHCMSGRFVLSWSYKIVHHYLEEAQARFQVTCEHELADFQVPSNMHDWRMTSKLCT